MGLLDKIGVSADVGGLAGSVIGSIGNAIQTRKYLKAQAKENQKNREYNLMLARQQNQWNIEQWQRENDYNSPTAQMARYRQAGLNPDLIYGQQNTSAASPALTSGAPSSPNDMSAMLSQRNFGTAVQAAINEGLDIKLKKAQINNINADTGQKQAGTQKTIKEVEALTIDNLTRAALNNQALQIGDTVLILNKKAAGLTDAQKENLIQSTNNLRQAYDNNKFVIKETLTRIKGMELDNIEKAKETIRRDKRLDAELQQFYDNHRQALVNLKISEQEFKEAVESWPLRLAGFDLQNKQVQATIDKLGLENIRLDLENDQIEIDTQGSRWIKEALSSDNVGLEVAGTLMVAVFDALKKFSFGIFGK